jgi:antitoxin component of RelBE/YafQ-DinJ toxin-antitoxin module
MESRIQFRVSEEVKKLAQLTAEQRGTTLSDECRALTEKLANEQRAKEEHDSWLMSEISKAYEKLESGSSEFYSEEEAEGIMATFKERVRQSHTLKAS